MTYRPIEKLKIANLPTPIQALNSSLFANVDLYIKRDDLTEMELSGNKVRKLEYVMAHVLAHHYDSVITCGGLQSNHARATAFLAAKLGLKCHLILATAETKCINGNYLMNQFAGAKIDYVPEIYFENGSINDYMIDYKNNLIKKGENPYIIPMGASDYIGNLGYIDCLKEIRDSAIPFDKIIVPVGSGGTYAGLLLGAKLYLPDVKIIGFNVRLKSDYFADYILKIANQTIEHYDLGIEIHQSDIQIIDGYVGEGYGKASKPQMAFLREFCQEQGMMLDATYAGKCLYALSEECNKGTFKGEKLLWIHTGGIFGIFGNPEYFY